jgi:hypothetical protein
MSMISVEFRRVKPTRHSARPAAPYGAGVYPTRTRFEPSDEDRAAAVLMFADDADWDARMAAGLECEACNRPVEPGELEMGLCCVCMTRAEEATMRSQYIGVGMGRHSY